MSRFAHRIAAQEMIVALWRNRTLAGQLLTREVVGRYRGSVMGMAWSLFNPLLMLLVYTFVFGVVLKVRWTGQQAGEGEFAAILFAGMLVFNLFAECITRAPDLILANPSYVKKVVFPLEIMPWVLLGAAAFHLVISLAVLFVYAIAIGHPLAATALLLPLVMLPLAFMVLGVCWILSSLGVYLRDIGQFVGLLTTAAMFVSPVFYPVSSLPDSLKFIATVNPLAQTIEQARGVLIWGTLPDWSTWSGQLLASSVIAWLGFVWFQKSRNGFADVI